MNLFGNPAGKFYCEKRNRKELKEEPKEEKNPSKALAARNEEENGRKRNRWELNWFGPPFFREP